MTANLFVPHTDSLLPIVMVTGSSTLLLLPFLRLGTPMLFSPAVIPSFFHSYPQSSAQALTFPPDNPLLSQGGTFLCFLVMQVIFYCPAMEGTGPSSCSCSTCLSVQLQSDHTAWLPKLRPTLEDA